MSWDDQPPAGFATGSSTYNFIGPSGPYRLGYYSKDEPEKHRLYYNFAQAKKDAEAFIKEWMDDNGVKFGEGVTPQYQRQLDSLYNHDWVGDGYR